MSKKLIIIWANCQGNGLCSMLNAYYSNDYNCIHYPNHEYMANNTPLPDNFFNADIFLCQLYSNGIGDYCMQNIINKLKTLNDKCIIRPFPTLHNSQLYFCYDYTSVANSATISPKYPHGKFCYGILPVIQLISSYDIEHILNLSNSESFISHEQIQLHYDKSMGFLKHKCDISDMSCIYEYVLNNFKKQRLWHNPNHPSGILMNELVKCVFDKLNLTYPIADNERNIKLLNNLNDWVMPIFPSIQQYYNLEFDCNVCSSIWHPSITNIDTYLTEYCTQLYLQYNINN